MGRKFCRVAPQSSLMFWPTSADMIHVSSGASKQTERLRWRRLVFRGGVVVVCALAMSVVMTPIQARAQSTSEYEIKAAFPLQVR